ncbi:MAG TPA: hydrogenase maturation nickel metallochaperone HypA [Firmicutes bacterium]|nr:hydrogenase maturation nickel metallochaperone HypA [Bacillota bacterium]
MHEVSIANHIYKIVLNELEKQEKFPKLQKIKLKIGKLSAVVPDALDFAWNAIVKGTNLENSILEIEEIPVILKCHDCKSEFNIEYPVFLCENCGSNNTELMSGDELDIVSLIIDE